MISLSSMPSKAVHADFRAPVERRRTASDEWSESADKSERGFHQGVRVAVIELLAIGAAAGLVLLVVWLFRWAVLSPATWGLLSPILATAVSVALMGGLVWATKVDRESRSDISAARRAARRARDAKRSQVMLSQAITTADTLALTTGAIWLDQTEKRSGLHI